MTDLLQRYESYRGRTTPEIEWRIWNGDHTSYMAFKTKREATAYLSAVEGCQARDDLAAYVDFMDQVITA